MKRICVMIAAGAMALAVTTPSQALESYSATEKAQFLDWCTGTKSASESTCSCALKKVAQTVPAAALTSYLASVGSGQSMSLTSLATTSGAMTATTVAQALTTCGN